MRSRLIQTAADLNANYRCDKDDRDLELGFLFGTAEMVAALLIAEGLSHESFSDLRHAIAKEIDKLASGESYVILKEKQ